MDYLPEAMNSGIRPAGTDSTHRLTGNLA